VLFADNGGEFTGYMVAAYHHGTRIDFSRLGKPTDNAFIKTFYGSLRNEWERPLGWNPLAKPSG
jgi:putative transposase